MVGLQPCLWNITLTTATVDSTVVGGTIPYSEALTVQEKSQSQQVPSCIPSHLSTVDVMWINACVSETATRSMSQVNPFLPRAASGQDSLSL